MKSKLQDAFLEELVARFKATSLRLTKRIDRRESDAEIESLVTDELRGLYHGVLVVFDGGSALADKGLIQIVDEDGVAFDSYLHEICFGYWPDENWVPLDQ